MKKRYFNARSRWFFARCIYWLKLFQTFRHVTRTTTPSIVRQWTIAAFVILTMKIKNNPQSRKQIKAKIFFGLSSSPSPAIRTKSSSYYTCGLILTAKLFWESARCRTFWWVCHKFQKGNNEANVWLLFSCRPCMFVCPRTYAWPRKPALKQWAFERAMKSVGNSVGPAPCPAGCSACATIY